MLGVKKNDIDCLLHLLLGVIAQGEDFYNQQKEEIKSFFGDDIFYKAEGLLQNTRLYELLSSVD